MWQCFWSPSALTKTKNPIEQFNRAIKRDHTLRSLLPLTTLLEKFMLLCETEPVFSEELVTQPRQSVDTMKRYKDMQKAHLCK